jgi:spore germination protein
VSLKMRRKRKRRILSYRKNFERIPLDMKVEGELSDDLDDNEALLRQIFSNCSDFYMRKVVFFNSVPAVIVYFQGLVESEHIETALLKPLSKYENVPYDHSSSFIEWMRKNIISVAQTETITDLQEVVQRIVQGDAILLMEASKESLTLDIQSKQLDRQPQESLTESVIRGPHMSFIENLDTNIAFIRTRIRSPRLKIKKFIIGEITRTEVAMTYIEKIASPEVIHEIEKRLLQIDIDAILESGAIEELISDGRYSPFPLMQMSERPDTVAGLMLDGKVAIFVDGTPMTLIVPSTFWQGFQTVEDYNTNFIFATALRWLRFLFMMIALLLPSFYVAVASFHQEMIPTGLALSIAAAREVAPFPTFMEALMMEIAFEGLREAGIRLPTPIGPTISIVGALVIGEAAVQAGIISAPIVIVVALTGIASFLIPKINMNNAIRLLRFPMLLLSGMFGLYGMGIILLAILIHLTNLRSVGVPYLTPVAPFQAKGLWDVFIRAPIWIMYNRKEQTKDEHL